MRLIRRLGLLSWALAAAHVLCAIAYAPAHAQDVLKDPASFARLYESWTNAADEDRGLALSQEMLRLEPYVLSWPLKQPRHVVKGQLWYYVGYAYHQRAHGKRSDNLEQAIEAYSNALLYYARKTYPRDWADIHVQRALAYRQRMRESRAANIERAIADLRLALVVHTPESLPQEWSRTQVGLAEAYLERIAGDRADNIEYAIARLETVVRAGSGADRSEALGSARLTLGVAYRNRLTGTRSENIEKAIAALQQAGEIFSRETHPEEWAQVQNNLGNAFAERIKGLRADNLEKAIANLESALAVRTREGHSQEWAQTQNNLGVAYRNRLRGANRENIERAIGAYRAALSVRTKSVDPQLWAQTENNLAIAYLERTEGRREENIETAIEASSAALSVFTKADRPQSWAQAQNTLALAYIARSIRGKEEDARRAVVAAKEALSVFTLSAFPQDWAENKHALGLALLKAEGSSGQAGSEAIAAFEDALTVFTKEAYPRLHLRTARQLGAALIASARWQDADRVLASAREAFLVLFGQGLEPVEAESLITEAGPLFSDAAFVAAELGQADRAFELAAEGKARLLAVTLRLNSLKLSAAARERLHQLRTAIREEERVAEGANGAARGSAIDKLIAYRRELLSLVEAASASDGTEGALATARRAVAKGGAVAVPVLNDRGSKILMVTAATAAPVVVEVPQLTKARLAELMRGKVSAAGLNGGWLGAYQINYLPGPLRVLRWREWQTAIDDLSTELWDMFAARLGQALTEHGVKRGERLVWLPSGSLGIVPLGLAAEAPRRQRMLDLFEIVYAPSLQALTASPNDRGPATLAAVVNPTGDLPGTVQEAAVVASFFPTGSASALAGEQASLDGVLALLKGRTHWHFASHGVFVWDDARASALVLNGDERLSVGRLLETEGLGAPRLVVLSACETGLYDIDRNADEFVGLAGAFVAMGAGGVIATLWPVDDTATSLLMAKLYKLHIEGGLPPARALQEAQTWLRSASEQQLQAFEQELARAQPVQAASAEGSPRLAFNRVRPRTKGSNAGSAVSVTEVVPEHPYAHPYYWAGFILTGQ